MINCEQKKSRFENGKGKKVEHDFVSKKIYTLEERGLKGRSENQTMKIPDRKK